MTQQLPYLTSDLPGIGGRIKQSVEDFQVREVPRYSPSGQGTHLYFRVIKRGVPTPVAVERIARHMGVRPPDIGVAGLKDATALTTQMMSLEHADAERLKHFKDSQIEVELLGLHTNKLRPGHLAGNEFVIRIRGVGAQQLPAARQIVEVLSRRGVPNYYGEQRFGARGDTAKLGELLVRNDLDEFIRQYLGRPQASDPSDCKAAREDFDAGFYERALNHWPRHYANERKALSAYKKKKHAGPAMAAIDKRMKRLYVSAFQSELFNEVLVERLSTLDRVLYGDLAVKPSGAAFYVLDEAAEAPRAAALEISPSGPIIGTRCNLAAGVGYEIPVRPAKGAAAGTQGEQPPAATEGDEEGEIDAVIEPVEISPGQPVPPPPTQQLINPGKIERDVLARHNVTGEDFRHIGSLKVKGTRRPLRFALQQPLLQAGIDGEGPYVELSFIAPSGCYATVVLREIMKSGE